MLPIIGDDWHKENIAQYWDSLELDPFMNDGGVYRKRRFGRFNFSFTDNSLILNTSDITFFQDNTINKLNGGVQRTFSPVCREFSQLHTLRKIVNYCQGLLPVDTSNFKALTVNTHLFRITAEKKSLGLPTPEGIHRDGHHFVSQHLIARNNIFGGVSGIYCNNEIPKLHRQLYYPMDTIIVDDSKVKHDVSPIFQIDRSISGYRDMLIIDYNFI